MRTVASSVGWDASPVVVCVLGPVHLEIAGKVVEVPGPKRKSLLALLAEADRAAVSVERLVDSLWPDGAPASALSTLHSHVSRLRTHLGPAAVRLEHGPAGYRMDLGPRGTDASIAADLLDRSASAEPLERVELLAQARRLWRGPVLGGVEVGDALSAWSVHLESLHDAIDRAYIHAAIAADDVDVALDVARMRAAANPLSEPAALDVMHALAERGQVADALRAAYEHREAVIAETGFEPSDELRSLESALATREAPAARPVVVRPAVRVRGRRREMQTLQRLIESERVVTVVGPGGVGKSTLASEVGSRFEPAVAVRLAAIPPEADVVPALAESLALQVTHGDVRHACTALLGAGRWLVVLDGCEHVLQQVRSLTSHLLDHCPQVTVLATSREPLGLAAEQRLRVGPLDLAAPTGGEDLDESPAVAVFVDRARRIDPDLAFDSSELDLITDIVRRVEGMPMAIELAAGRLSALGITDLHARLGNALTMLDGGEGSLRQTIAWSYDLLPPAEHRLLRHLSVFPDGVDLETAEAVAADLDLGMSTDDAISHLVDASTLDRTDVQDTVRYRQLDLMRAFTGELLDVRGEMAEATERFLCWGLALAQRIEAEIYTDAEPDVDAVLRRELPNLRATWTMLRTAGRLYDTVRLALGVSEAVGWRDITEIWQWLLDLADDPDLVDHVDQTAVLGEAASIAWSRGELERARSLAERGLANGGSTSWLCDAALALVALSEGDLARAAELAAKAGDAATRPGQSYGVGALAAAYSGDLHLADQMRAELHDIACSPTLEAFDAYVAGEIASIREENAEALSHYDRSITVARQSGATLVEGIAAVGRLTTIARAGRTEDALAGHREVVEYWDRTGGWVQLWTTLRNLASLVLAMGDDATAVLLTVAADAAADAPPIAERDAAIDAVIARADPSVIETARTARRQQVVEWALHAIDSHGRGIS